MAEDRSWRIFNTSGGVALRYGPFPRGMYWDLMAKLLRDHPDPEPPKKEIETVDGSEWIDDLNDPEYRQASNDARMARFDKFGQFVLRYCVEIEDESWELEAESLRDWSDEVPDAGDWKLRVYYLTKMILRTNEDWEIITLVQKFSQVDEEDVAQRVEFFQRPVERAGGVQPNAPSPAP